MKQSLIPCLLVRYRTRDGEYRESTCRFSDRGIYFTNEYSQDWALRELPHGSDVRSIDFFWDLDENACATLANSANEASSPRHIIH